MIVTVRASAWSRRHRAWVIATDDGRVRVAERLLDRPMRGQRVEVIPDGAVVLALGRFDPWLHD